MIAATMGADFAAVEGVVVRWPLRDYSDPKHAAAPTNSVALHSFTGADWTAATKRLTGVGLFTAYTFVAGDLIEISDGTGAQQGVYRVASKVDNNTLELMDLIANDDITASDVDGVVGQDETFTSALTVIDGINADVSSGAAGFLEVRAHDGVTQLFRLVMSTNTANENTNKIFLRIYGGFSFVGEIAAQEGHIRYRILKRRKVPTPLP